MAVAKFLKNIRKEEKNFLKAPIYLYGTENMGGYYQALKLKGRSVLTINGSGDQVLNAYYFGAKKVVGFDIVKNTKYMLDLKIAAIKGLNHRGFLDFFGDKNRIGNFDYATYSSLEKYLEDETIEFFDELFEKYNQNGRRLLESGNFRKRKEFYVKLDEINPFLANEKNYMKMREKIWGVNLEFIEADIYDIHKRVKGHFDIINLSNVFNYVAGSLRREGINNPFETIYQKIFINLKAKLEDKGKIIFYYFYRTPEELKTYTPLINKKSKKWVETQGDFKVSKMKVHGILQGKDTVDILELI